MSKYYGWKAYSRFLICVDGLLGFFFATVAGAGVLTTNVALAADIPSTATASGFFWRSRREPWSSLHFFLNGKGNSYAPVLVVFFLLNYFYLKAWDNMFIFFGCVVALNVLHYIAQDILFFFADFLHGIAWVDYLDWIICGLWVNYNMSSFAHTHLSEGYFKRLYD